MKLSRDNSFSACVNLNKWRCSSLSSQERRQSGMNIGKRSVKNGTHLWGWEMRITDFTITLNSLTTPMQLVISNSISLWVSKNLRGFTHARTSILKATRSTAVKNFDSSILKQKRASFLTSLKRRSVLTACFSQY